MWAEEKYWKDRTERAKRNQDPIQVRDRETLIYLLQTYAKEFKSEFGKRIEQAATLYLKDEDIDEDELRKQVQETKKIVSLDSIDYVDMLIAYLSISDDAKLVNLYNGYLESYMNEYVPGDMKESMKQRAWLRADSKSQFLYKIYDLDYEEHARSRWKLKDDTIHGYDGSIKKILIKKYVWTGKEYKYHYLWRDGELFQTIDAEELLNIYRFLLFDKDIDKEALVKKLRGLLDEFVKEVSEETSELKESFPSHFLKNGGSRKALQSYIDIGIVNIEELDPNLLLENVEVQPIAGNWIRSYIDYVPIELRIKHAELEGNSENPDPQLLKVHYKDEEDRVVERIIKAFKNVDDSVVKKDDRTNTYPFMQAAANKDCGTLDLLFFLLRRNPKPVEEAASQIRNKFQSPIVVSRGIPDESQKEKIITSDSSDIEPKQKLLSDEETDDETDSPFLACALEKSPIREITDRTDGRKYKRKFVALPFYFTGQVRMAKYWKERTARVKLRHDPKQIIERENLIYFLEKILYDPEGEYGIDFREKVEDAAKKYLESESLSIEKLEKRSTRKFKGRDLVITYVDIVIKYLKASEASLKKVHCYHQIIIDYAKGAINISKETEELMKSDSWKRLDCKSAFMRSFIEFKFRDANDFLIRGCLWDSGKWKDIDYDVARELLNVYRFLHLDRNSSTKEIAKKIRQILDDFVRSDFVLGDSKHVEHGMSFPHQFFESGGSRQTMQRYIDVGIVTFEEVDIIESKRNEEFLELQNKIKQQDEDIGKYDDRIQSLELQLSKQTDEIARKNKLLLELQNQIKQQGTEITKYEKEIRAHREERDYSKLVEFDVPAEILSSTEVSKMSNEAQHETVMIAANSIDDRRYSKRLKILKMAVPIKREDIVDGVIKCPRCQVSIVTGDKGCNIITCRNHSPHFVYFCIHCKKVNENGVEYVTCSCESRNTRETRAEAQKRRNKEAKANPIELE